MFYRIRDLAGHLVVQLFPQLFTAGRSTSHNLAMHPFTLVCPRCRTSQYLHTFILACVSLWNMLYESDFAGDGLGAFKTAVNRTLRVRFSYSLFFFWTYITFYLALLLFLTLFYHVHLSLSPLIILWVCDSVGVLGIVGSGL